MGFCEREWGWWRQRGSGGEGGGGVGGDGGGSRDEGAGCEGAEVVAGPAAVRFTAAARAQEVNGDDGGG